MENLTPILTPILNLLRSRKFIVSAIALIINMIIARAPELEPMREILCSTVTAIALVLIGGIAYEDAAKTGKEAGEAPRQTTEQYARDLAGVALDEIMLNPDSTPQSASAQPVGTVIDQLPRRTPVTLASRQVTRE